MSAEQLFNGVFNGSAGGTDRELVRVMLAPRQNGLRRSAKADQLYRQSSR